MRQAPFLVLSGTRMPSALVEIGFISHPQESKQLAKEKYQDKVARSLADAVRDFADKVLARRLVAQARPPAASGRSAQPPSRVEAAELGPTLKVASPVGTR